MNGIMKQIKGVADYCYAFSFFPMRSGQNPFMPVRVCLQRASSGNFFDSLVPAIVAGVARRR